MNTITDSPIDAQLAGASILSARESVESAGLALRCLAATRKPLAARWARKRLDEAALRVNVAEAFINDWALPDEGDMPDSKLVWQARTEIENLRRAISSLRHSVEGYAVSE